VSILLGVLVGGIAFGSVYAMLAIGFSLLWQMSRTINFAQGDFVTVVGFVFVAFAVTLGWPLALAAAAAVVVAAILLGIVVRKTIIARLLRHGVLPLVVASIALSILIQNFFVAFVTAQAEPAPSLFPTGVIHVDGVSIGVDQIGNFVVATLMIVALQIFLHRTRTGKALRATAQNGAAARVVGIDPARMITIAFVINAVLVAVAAILLSPIFAVQYNQGTGLGLDAFYAAIIGGFNRIRGALVGGVLVGLLESVGAAYVSSAYDTGIVVAVLMIVLLVRPEGLLGARELVREYHE